MRFLRPTLFALVVVLTLAAPASADRLRQLDPAGDVARSLIGSSVYTAAAGHREGDIVATRVVHAPRAVWVRIRFRELTTTTNGNFELISVKSDRRFRELHLDAFPGHWDGAVTTTGRRGRIVACAVRHHIDYDRNLVVVKVPRRCLGKPRWVRVAIRSTIAGTKYAYADDARSSGIGAALVYGRRIRH